MTINIPLKAVAFVLYTLALLGGAFGISYAVFEWRDTGSTAVELDERLDDLRGRVGSLEVRRGGDTYVGARARACHDALAELTFALGELLASNTLGPSLAANVNEIEVALNRNC